MPLPNLLIAGCQKSGTTWLHHTLKKSPQFYGSKPKELNFFNRSSCKKRIAEYAGHFPETNGVRYYYESTPHYYRLPEGGVDIACNIHEVLGKPELIVLFRNPVDRYESAYRHHMIAGRIPWTPEITDITNDFKMLELGMYASITEHWLSIFSVAHFHLYDELADKRSLCQHIFKQLGVDYDLSDDSLEFVVNESETKASRLGWDELPRLSRDARDKLIDHYAAEIERLGRILKRDLSKWHSGAAVETDR